MHIQTSPEFAAAIAALQPGQRRHGDRIPLDLIDDSPFNARKTYNEQSLAELAETIEQHGVQEPILLRPMGERFQLVFGHRRTRAARRTKLVDIPAMIEVMDDAQAAVLQLIENVERDALTPLEEAQGYRDLMDKHGFTIKDLAAKTKRSVRSVQYKLRLLDLCEEAREALASGELSESMAAVIARVHGDDDQLEAMGEILDRYGYGDGPMSVRDAQAHVRKEYSVQLHKALFNLEDATIVPAAGACSACPKRACAQPELYADDESKDLNICLDRACFKQKREAHLELEKAAAEEEGRKVLSPKEGNKLLKDGAGTNRLVNLDAPCHQAPRDLITNEFPTYGQLLSGTDIKPTLVDSGAGLVAAVEQNAALKLLASKGAVSKVDATRIIAHNNSRGTGSKSRLTDSERKRQHEAKVQRQVREDLFDLIHEFPETLHVDEDLARSIVLWTWDRLGWDHQQRICKKWGWLNDGDGRPSSSIGAIRIKNNLDITRLTWLLVQMSVVSDVAFHEYQMAEDPARLVEVAKRMGINVAAVKANAAAKHPLQQPPKAVKAAKPAKASPTPSTAAAAAGKGAKKGSARKAEAKATPAAAAPAAAGAGQDATDLFAAAHAGQADESQAHDAADAAGQDDDTAKPPAGQATPAAAGARVPVAGQRWRVKPDAKGRGKTAGRAGDVEAVSADGKRITLRWGVRRHEYGVYPLSQLEPVEEDQTDDTPSAPAIAKLTPQSAWPFPRPKSQADGAGDAGEHTEADA